MQMRNEAQSEEIKNFIVLIKSTLYLVFLICYLPYFICKAIIQIHGSSIVLKKLYLNILFCGLLRIVILSDKVK